MASTWGNHIKLSIFGESHGPAIGAVLDGLPAGEAIDLEEVLLQMKRRAPGQDRSSTPRKEGDVPRILSGMLEGRTTGAPLAAVIENHNTRSGDYANLLAKPRPGHADFTGNVRYHGANDPRGGGHFSGRLRWFLPERSAGRFSPVKGSSSAPTPMRLPEWRTCLWTR